MDLVVVLEEVDFQITHYDYYRMIHLVEQKDVKAVHFDGEEHSLAKRKGLGLKHSRGFEGGCSHTDSKER